MLFKQAIASTLVGILLLCNTQVAFGADIEANIESVTTTEEVEKMMTAGVDDLAVQLNDLYKEVGKSLNIDYVYVKIMHLIAGGKAVYADKRPNIYAELTVDSMESPFYIEGATQNFAVQAPWANLPDETIERPNKYYLPDTAYSVTSEVVKLMNNRYYADRGQMQPYFSALNNDVKTNVIFCEAMLEYTGSSREAIESFYSSYEKILYEKEKDENVLESDGEGHFTFKDKFKTILTSNNISSARDLEILSIILSFDSKLAASSNPDTVKDEYVIPYIADYTSRENMMLASMSVVGKVRYVWGGGHLGPASINGINPAWEAFYDTYPTTAEEGTDGLNRCIQPTGCWCPIHKAVEAANGCLDTASVYYSVEDYVDSRKEIMDTQNMEDDKYSKLLDNALNFERGVNSHRLDGLDCSGYASWVYNQITGERNYDSGARNFISAGNLAHVNYGAKMLPGDVFSWGSHIVVVIGQVRQGSDAYVMVEASPNMVKFGAMYYGSASQADRAKAISVAKEANDLIGGIPLTEKTHVYNMDSVGFSESEESGRYAEIGRLKYSYLDENIVIGQYNKTMKDMTAQEIIQYTIDNITPQYVTGLNTYTGTVYNTDKLKSTTLDSEIVLRNEEAVKAATVEDTDKAVSLTPELKR